MLSHARQGVALRCKVDNTDARQSFHRNVFDRDVAWAPLKMVRAILETLKPGLHQAGIACPAFEQISAVLDVNESYSSIIRIVI